MARRRRNPMHTYDRTPGDFGGMLPPRRLTDGRRAPVERVHGLTYKLWMRAVDEIVQERHGMSVHDGVDWASYDSWSIGDDPEEGYENWCSEQAESLGIEPEDL